MLALALALMALQAAPAYDAHVTPQGADEAESLVILCDPRAFRFSVRVGADPASLDRTYPERTVVKADTLMQALPGWTNQMDVQGPLVRYVRCGPYTMKLQGDAYNTHVQGEAGAYSAFVAVTVLRGPRIIYPAEGGATRFTACSRTLRRADPCPTGYAVRLDGRYDDKRKALDLVETVTSYEDDEGGEGRQTSTRRLTVPEDLELWKD